MRNHLISLALSFVIGSSAPDPVRLSLEAESARWFRDLLISGGVVALGCLLEIWETAVSMKNWRRARRGLGVHENPRSWAIPIAAFGLLLVIGGVTCEVFFEGLSSTADAKLREHESDVLSDAETQAATANQKAGDANQSAGAANERAGANEKKASQLSKEAEDERMARVQIEAAVAFRQLTPKQKEDLGNALSRFKGLVGVSFWYQSSDTEAQLFGDDIAEALRAKGAIIQPPASILSMRETGKYGDPIVGADTGVTVQSTRVGAAPEFATALIKELNDLGFDAKRQTDPPFDNGTDPLVWVNVDPRPKGPQGEYKLQQEAKAQSNASAKR